MVKIERHPIPPASLAIEAAKAQGSYAKPDVIRKLREDSHDKCYICELKGLTDPQVEHLYPHKNREYKERVFDWNNLFYVCPHCNNIKKEEKYTDKIIDCCEVDPEAVLEHVNKEGHVSIHSISDDESVKMTADLIEMCFEKRNTGIREAACQYRIKELEKSMTILYRTLENHKNNENSKRYQSSLRQMLSRESEFAAFKRYYVRKHLKDYPKLKEYVL